MATHLALAERPAGDRAAPAATDGQATPANDLAPLDTAHRPPATLLRFITCGSVDDGKSTLIGRMLYEAGAVFDDQLETLESDSRRFGTQGAALDFALLVDGLSAEREQGITIDVAYRYFATPKRSFIVADTPGHEQFTRNMATGASTADVAIILVDARKGLLPQTRRHSFIVSALGVRDVIVAINKMDLVNFDEAIFARIEADYRAATAGLGFRQIQVVPVSARDGDNVVARSARTPWYRGEALLPLLETIEPQQREQAAQGFVLPVQWVNRPDLDFRGFAGTLARGRVAIGDRVTVLPSGRSTSVARILVGDREAGSAKPGQAVTLVTTDEVDIARGDVLVAAGTSDVRVGRELRARLLWTGSQSLDPGGTYQLKLATRVVNARVAGLDAALDIETFAVRPATTLAMNGIGDVRVVLDAPLATMPYAQSRDLGGFILIDRISNETVAFGLVVADPGPLVASPLKQGLRKRALAWLGPSGSLQRRARLQALSWRLSSAAILGLVVLALTGSVAAALLAGGLDAVLRPVLRRAHEVVWRRQEARLPAADIAESGGGI